MTTRRTFIKIAAISGVPVAVGSSDNDIAIAQGASSRTEFHAVLVDGENAAAQAFSKRFRTSGTKVISIPEGDITAAWLGYIRPSWSRSPVAITGLTTASTLFCLEQLAWSHGLRVVFHAEHIALPDGSLEHHVQRDAQMARLTASTLNRAGSRWPLRLAAALATRSNAPAGRRPGPSLAALQPTLPEGAQLLTSWIIAAA